MNILSIKNVALGLTLAATVISAKAQKNYTKGIINYNINAAGQDVDAKAYFNADTSSLAYQQGPASVKMISTTKGDYFAVLVDVPVASIKKAGIATPAEMEEAKDAEASYTFTPTAETKKIGDFACKKYLAKEAKSGATYDLWMTTDISAPANVLTRYFTTIPGVPVLFTYLRGKVAQTVTLKSVSDAKLPAGVFAVPSDFDKISLTDLMAMSGGRN